MEQTNNPIITVNTPTGTRRVRLSVVINKLWPRYSDDAAMLNSKMRIANRIPHNARFDLIDAIYNAIEDL